MHNPAPSGDAKRPRKRDFRQRAHCNPLADSFIRYPRDLTCVDWSLHFPRAYGKPNSTDLHLNTYEEPIDYKTQIASADSKSKVTILDVGCGYGGLLINLSPLFPNDFILGLEIREKIVQYVGKRIVALRSEGASAEKHPTSGLGPFDNISVLRTNAMKFLMNYIQKDSLTKMFFCFPDPHVKRSKWRRRIVNRGLLTKYAYVLKEGGRVYTITDVPDLHEWMVTNLKLHPYFRQLSEEEMKEDPCVELMYISTEEGNKARREQRSFKSAVFEKMSFQGACLKIADKNN